MQKQWKVRQSAQRRERAEARTAGEPYGIVLVKGEVIVRPLRKALKIHGQLLEEVMP